LEREAHFPFTYGITSISLTLWRNGCPSHQEKDARSPYPTMFGNLESRRRERVRLMVQ